MTTEPVQAVGIPVAAAFAIDAVLLAVRFALNVLLLAGLVMLCSRREAELRPKKTILVTFGLVALLFLANTSPDGRIGIYPYFIVSLLGALICRKVFWIDIDKALISSFLFVFLSISLADYSERAMDALMPNRTTIGGTLADAMDRRTQASTGDTSLPPSRRVMPALLRMAADPDSEGGILNALLALRAGQKAKAQIADVDKLARDQASIVNMLSGAGTNVGTRADELAAMRQALEHEAGGGGAPVPGAAPAPQGTPPSAPPTRAPQAPGKTEAAAAVPRHPAPEPSPSRDTTDSGDTFAEHVVKAVAGVPSILRRKKDDPDAPAEVRRPTTTMREAPGGTAAPPQPADDDAVVAVERKRPVAPPDRPTPVGEAGVALAYAKPKEHAASAPAPAPAPAAVAVVVAAKDTTNAVPAAVAETVASETAEAIPTDPGAEEQELWAKAEAAIHVSGKGWSGGSAYVLIAGKFLRPSGTWTVTHANRKFTFRLKTVDRSGDCEWEPVLTAVESEEPESFLAF